MTDAGASELPKNDIDLTELEKEQPPRLRELSSAEKNKISMNYYFLIERTFEY